MKHFYFLSALMAFATFADAQTTSPKAAMARKMMGLSTTAAAPQGAKSLKAAALPAAKVDASIYDFKPKDIITATPQGEYQELFRTSSMWQYGSDGLDTLTISGVKSAVVYGADNQVWIKNPVAAYPTDAWLKGTVDGDVLHFPLPQPIYTYDGAVYCAERLVMNPTVTGFIQDEDVRELTLKRDGDKLVWGERRERPDDSGYTDALIIGIVRPNGQWAGYGDFAFSAEPMTYTLTTMPAGVTATDHSFAYNDYYSLSDGMLGKLAQQGSDVWAQLAGRTFHGTKSGSKVIFDRDQLVGENAEMCAYEFFQPIEIHHLTMTEPDGYTWGYDSMAIARQLVFTLDEAKGTLTTDGSFAFNAGIQAVAYDSIFTATTIAPWKLEATQPQDPDFTGVQPWMQYNPRYKVAGITFDLHKFSVDGKLIRPEDMYYNVWFDDELFVLTPEDYVALPVELYNATDIPYTYDDHEDFFISAYKHNMFYYMDGIETIGVQLVSTAAGEVKKSRRVTLHTIGETTGERLITTDEEGYTGTTDGISAVAAASQQAEGVAFTDLQGRRVSRPEHGIYIRTYTTADGQRRADKVMVK